MKRNRLLKIEMADGSYIEISTIGFGDKGKHPTHVDLRKVDIEHGEDTIIVEPYSCNVVRVR